MREFTILIGAGFTKSLDNIVKKFYINYFNLKQNNKSNSIELKIKNNILDSITFIIDKFINDLFYRINNKKDNLEIVTFDLDTQLEYYNLSKELIIDKTIESILEKEKSKSIDKQNCQEKLTYSFTIVELYTNTDYSSIIFNLFIIFLSKYIFLLIYNYFCNTNIIIFSNINFLIFYTTFRHALFKIMGGNYKKNKIIT